MRLLVGVPSPVCSAVGSRGPWPSLGLLLDSRGRRGHAGKAQRPARSASCGCDCAGRDLVGRSGGGDRAVRCPEGPFAVQVDPRVGGLGHLLCGGNSSCRTKTVATRPELASGIPAGLLVAIAGVTSVLPLAQGSGWYVAGGSDNLTHLVFALRRGQTGFLDYAIDAYPGAWASAMALLATASTSSVEPSPELLYGWVRTESASVWLLFATLSLAVGFAAQQLASRAPSLHRQASFLGFGAAATLLGSAFWGFTVPFGFQTHILATLAVVVGVLEVSTPRPQPMRAVWVLTLCGTVAAHSWTLAAAYLIAPWSWAVWCAMREPGRRLRTALALCAAAAALSVGPLVFALSTQVGVSRAAVYGAAAAAPVTWVVGGLLSNAALWRWGGLAAIPLAASALGLACTVALTVHVGASLADYYPSKMLWLGGVSGCQQSGWWGLVPCRSRSRKSRPC